MRFVKSKRMTWLGHVMWMEGKIIPKRVLELKPTGRRNRGRPRKRWIEDIEEDIQIMKKKKNLVYLLCLFLFVCIVRYVTS